MPKIQFSTDNVKRSAFDFPKLKLNKEERARLALVEPVPEFEYVHRIESPKIEDGHPVMKFESRKDGTQYETNVTDFIASPICLGDIDVLQEKGTDPDNCPICRLAANTGHAKAPQRRFAMHVVRYATKPGGFDVASPFRVENIVWSFTDTLFNKIVEFQEAWKEEGGLQKHDLLLGPCTNPVYQKAELQLAPTAEWLKDAERKAITIQTIKENRAKDLSVFCGSRIPEGILNGHIERVEAAWAEIKRAESRGAQPNPVALESGLDSLLNSAKPEAPKQVFESMADLLGGAEPATGHRTNADWEKEAPKATSAAVELPELPEVHEVAPVTAAPAAAAEEPAEDDEFAAFLNGLEA